MPRLLLHQNGVLRHLASVNVTNDGSIVLNLVREGISDSGFVSSPHENGLGPLEVRQFSQQKTKSISIHTSGRVNYHFDRAEPRYLPCLLDLDAPVVIILYSIPAVKHLDQVVSHRKDDHVIEVPQEQTERIHFTFQVLPAVLPAQTGEIGRFGVEGLYALSWSASAEDISMRMVGAPEEVFTTLRPGDGLPNQAISEEVVFLRFKRAMYANDVISAVKMAPNRDEITAQQIEAAIEAGPGIYPPNSEGVWTVLAIVPMRIAPRLDIDFEDSRYKAEVIEYKPGDTRLSTVRVRFKVFDDKEKKYVKERVAIKMLSLNAEL
jgi:hypothetical protein